MADFRTCTTGREHPPWLDPLVDAASWPLRPPSRYRSTRPPLVLRNRPVPPRPQGRVTRSPAVHRWAVPPERVPPTRAPQRAAAPRGRTRPNHRCANRPRASCERDSRPPNDDCEEPRCAKRVVRGTAEVQARAAAAPRARALGPPRAPRGVPVRIGPRNPRLSCIPLPTARWHAARAGATENGTSPDAPAWAPPRLRQAVPGGSPAPGHACAPAPRRAPPRRGPGRPRATAPTGATPMIPGTGRIHITAASCGRSQAGTAAGERRKLRSRCAPAGFSGCGAFPPLKGAAATRGGTAAVPPLVHVRTTPDTAKPSLRSALPFAPTAAKAQRLLGAAVLCRTTRLVARSRRRLGGCWPRLSMSASRVASSAISVSGWRTVVSGGPTQRATGRSS
ncbi:hypothetical protein EKD16_13500 [Streptomonospora litoralis]|uniref:Uncharacterized protein n=1 Tax=Streptomonospora litoralis TaxID=2498135 RepID=A0A4V0ZJS3_9ACTN|nr:hypothetical protein EKD16_13500 [Streptomonospora litoralis]